MTKKEIRIFLGFDFYGAGNIGDDLMVQGFINTLKRQSPSQVSFPLTCVLPRDIVSQQRRFPMVDWYCSDAINQEVLLSKQDCWVGVGDTPFQIQCGPWFLNKLMEDVKLVNRLKKPMYMIGVGAESEVAIVAHSLGPISQQLTHVWTRDDFTKEFLIKKARMDSQKISLGADLAHIALREIFGQRGDGSPQRSMIAINYFSEGKNRKELSEVKLFIQDVSTTEPVMFIGNETRQGMGAEYDIYQELFGGFLNWFAKSKVKFYVPNYESSSLVDLVRHFEQYDVVMSSRYHALLTAAWAGCKVVALTRSSKIKALADELGMPIVEGLLTKEKLKEGLSRAVRVPRSLLEQGANRAEESVAQLVCRLNATIKS